MPTSNSELIFRRALVFVLQREGGYVNNPADRGGATNKGVTQATYNDYRHRKSLPVQSVRLITGDEVSEIYRQSYWSAARCDSLPELLAIVQFDTAVNSGVQRAMKFLQITVGVAADGIYGPATAQAVKSTDERRAVEKYLSLREDFYRRIVQHDPSQGRFLKGWMNRLNALEKEVLK